MLEKMIATKIRQIRQDQGLTLAQLGAKAGLSKGLLSRIESNQSSPPIATLSKIAQGLGVPIGVFFEDETEPPHRYFVTRRTERRQLVKPGTKIGFSYFSLSNRKPPFVMDAFVLHHAPFKKEPRLLFDHPGEEFLLVLKGEMELVYGQEKIRLNPGDAIHFDPSVPHRAQNVGQTEEGECLVVIIAQEHLNQRRAAKQEGRSTG
jgi:transcriptional regulator with XRE-family HTH domain